MRLGKEQAAGYVEDKDSPENTGSLEGTGSTVPVERTVAEALPANDPATAQPGGMPLTTATGPELTSR